MMPVTGKECTVACCWSLRLEPLCQPAAQDRRDRAVADTDTDNPRAVDPATGRRHRTPAYPRATRTAGPSDGNTDHTHCRGWPDARHPIAYSSLINATRVPELSTRRRRRPRDRLGRCAAPGTRPSRTAPADVVPHQPRPAPPPRGSCRRRPARSRTDRGWRCAAGPSMSARARTSAPQSGHVAGSGNRTSTANCARQPRHSPATVSRRAGFTAGRCAPSSRLPLISPPPRARCRPSELPGGASTR